jgi:hypothetical protein
MQRDQGNANRTDEEPRKKPGLLAKARARTERELDLLLSTDNAHYAAAALGQSPYIAMGNGVIVVQRKCGTWGC